MAGHRGVEFAVLGALLRRAVVHDPHGKVEHAIQELLHLLRAADVEDGLALEPGGDELVDRVQVVAIYQASEHLSVRVVNLGHQLGDLAHRPHLGLELETERDLDDLLDAGWGQI